MSVIQIYYTIFPIKKGAFRIDGSYTQANTKAFQWTKSYGQNI